jgi:hypothetical protein
VLLLYQEDLCLEMVLILCQEDLCLEMVLILCQEDLCLFRNGVNSAHFICEFCGKALKRPAELKKHIRDAHSEIRGFHCSQCDSAFKRSHRLKVLCVCVCVRVCVRACVCVAPCLLSYLLIS